MFTYAQLNQMLQAINLKPIAAAYAKRLELRLSQLREHHLSPVEPKRYLNVVQHHDIPAIEMPKHMRVACDEAMVREFTGSNHSELATRWKISVQWVYHCLKAAREKQIAREPS